MAKFKSYLNPFHTISYVSSFHPMQTATKLVNYKNLDMLVSELQNSDSDTDKSPNFNNLVLKPSIGG